MVLGVWLVGLAVYSTLLYRRFILTEDFATYNQAWTLIGQGHLNPFDTVFSGYPFLKSDFELIIWPLALIHLVFPHPVVLLWVQDLGVAGSSLIVYFWIVDFLERRKVSKWPSVLVVITVLAVIIANPAVYQTLGFDVHMEPISTTFVVLAGYDIWRGRQRRAWIWVGVALLCGTFAAVTIFGLGLSAFLAGPKTRRSGVLVAVTGLGWLGLVSVLGSNEGAGLSFYSYLAGPVHTAAPVGVAAIIAGVIAHPMRPISQLHDRLSFIFTLLEPVGSIGIASAWGFGVPLVVLVADGLNSSPQFIFQAFQNFAVFPFVLLGTVMVLIWAGTFLRFSWVASLVAGLMLAAFALHYGATTSPGDVRWYSSQSSAQSSVQLRKALALTPKSAEVITTIAIMGRFASRPYAYWYSPNGVYPLKSSTVVFVFDPARENTIPNANEADDITAIAFLQKTLHPKVLVQADGIWAFEWNPPKGLSEIKMPAPTPRT